MDRARPHFICPSCGTREQAANRQALERLEAVGLCQGCRALRTLRVRPALAPLWIDFWRRQGFPESASWLDALASDRVGRPGEGPREARLPSPGH